MRLAAGLGIRVWGFRVFFSTPFSSAQTPRPLAADRNLETPAASRHRPGFDSFTVYGLGLKQFSGVLFGML